MDNSKKSRMAVRPVKLVIPDGSMQEMVLNLLRKAGILFNYADSRRKKLQVESYLIESITCMRPQEIPFYLNRCCFDLAIVGSDWLESWNLDFEVLARLALSRQSRQPIRIVLAAPMASGYESVEDLPKDSWIATEYLWLAERWLASRGRDDIELVISIGGTEDKPNYGASAIIEAVETGASLVANGLAVIEEIMKSHTTIVANKDSYKDSFIKPVADWFAKTIQGVYDAGRFVRIEANVPTELEPVATRILGGLKAPTASRLTDPNWLSLTAYVSKEEQNGKVLALLNEGIKDICVSDNTDIIMGID